MVTEKRPRPHLFRLQNHTVRSWGQAGLGPRPLASKYHHSRRLRGGLTGGREFQAGLSHEQECQSISISGLSPGVMPRLSDLQSAGETCLTRLVELPRSQEKNEIRDSHWEAWVEPIQRCFGVRGGSSKTSRFFLPVEKPGPRKNGSVMCPRAGSVCNRTGLFSLLHYECSPALPCTRPHTGKEGITALRLQIGGKGSQMGCFEHSKISGSKTI